MAQDIRALFNSYAPNIRRYEVLAAEVAGRLTTLTHKAGLRPAVTHRAKDIRSLINKCLLYGGPVDRVPDKAGVKVVLRYFSEVQTVNALIAQSFVAISPPDEKAANYKPNELGYLGTHHQVKLPADRCPDDLLDLECEVIVHTGAQTLWDSITHELMYKPFLELPSASQRSLNRLLALVELFDKEVSAVRHEYLDSPMYTEAYMLDILEKYFYRLDPREYRRDMSIRTLEALSLVLSEDQINRLDDEMGRFVETNLVALERIYAQHQDANDLGGFFLHQPESLLIFAMFSWDQRHAVKRAWLSLYPRDYLEELGSMWGVPIPQ